MKKLLFIPFLLWASWAWAYHPGLVGVVTSSAAGVTHPADGAMLLGHFDTADAVSDIITSSNEVGADEGYTATWGESSTAEYATHAEVYAFDWDSGNVKIIIRTSAGQLVASSDSTSSSGWAIGWHRINFPSPVLITKGTTYRVTLNQSTNYAIKYHYSPSSLSVKYRASAYTTPPEYPAGSTLQAASNSVLVRVNK